MGVWTVEVPGVDCGEDHTPGGVRCPGHDVSVQLYRSTDTWTITVGGEDMILTDKLFHALLAAMTTAAGHG